MIKAIKTLEEYGLRFDIEENFLDVKSNGFQLESSLIRSTKALERLCFVLAMTTLYLVSVGTSVVKKGHRRLVDPHWFRGSSYLKIGWNWVNYALNRGYDLITSVYLSGEPDPEPAMASKKQDEKRRQARFVFAYQEAACRGPEFCQSIRSNPINDYLLYARALWSTVPMLRG